jgi:hypothetical protein
VGPTSNGRSKRRKLSIQPNEHRLANIGAATSKFVAAPYEIEIPKPNYNHEIQPQ